MNAENNSPSFFEGKKVLITGHTGFKGAWLSLWLTHHNANVFGVSNNIPTTPSLFRTLQLQKHISSNEHLDIRDKDNLTEEIKRIKPDFIFHMAAQPIVSVSYEHPVETIMTNVMGTTHLLEACRQLDNKCVTIIVTSDKCYENQEWIWGYKETDPMGGKDIYSSSKAATEILFSSYFRSFFKNMPNHRMASVRAGNVIGGGDWAQDRIVPDCMRAWNKSQKVHLRNPGAIRPWQHVLEPLSGYITLAHALWNNEQFNGESFNFGPGQESNITVLNLLSKLAHTQGIHDAGTSFTLSDKPSFAEAGLLKLSCEKAFHLLKWKPAMNINQVVSFTGEWYNQYFKEEQSMHAYTLQQIHEYENLARENKVSWAMNT